jgi:hypothetical protein
MEKKSFTRLGAFYIANWPFLVWTLPLQKLFLLAGLVLAHQYRTSFGDLFFIVPEGAFALLVTAIYQRYQKIGKVTRLLSVTAAFLAFASWFVIAPWAVSGTLLPYAQLKQFGSGAATFKTIIYSPSLLDQVLVWMGIFLILCVLALLLAGWAITKSFPRWLKRKEVIILLGMVLIGSALVPGEVRPTNRFAVIAPFFRPSVLSSRLKAIDPSAMAVLRSPNQRHTLVRSVPIINVLLIVLESVRYEPGSLLDQWFPKAVHLLRAYAHHPRSVKTIEALLFGIYPSTPLLTAAWSIDSYDVSRMNPLPQILRQNGYATSYYAGGNLGFDNYREVLKASGFERIETISSGKNSLAWGSDASTLFSAVEATLERGREKGQPQFIMAWTTECHMPYDFLGQKGRLEDAQSQYLACEDALAGSLDGMLKRMEHSGALDETLVVVLGDHGQIFSNEKEGEWGHGQHVYEQSVRIPLLLFVPRHNGGRDTERLFQPVDIPTTILSLFGISVPETWVGRNMLDPSETGREFVVFLSTLSDGIMGLMEKSGVKYIRNKPQGPFLCYNLMADPKEQTPQPVDHEMEKIVEGRVNAYLHVSTEGWESNRKKDRSGSQFYDGKDIAEQWSNGACIAIAGDEEKEVTLINPALNQECRNPQNLFMTRSISKTFQGRLFKEGMRLEFEVMMTQQEEIQGKQPRASVRVWGMEEPIVFDLRPTADIWQTVSAVLPKPKLSIDPSTGQEVKDLYLEIVPIDLPVHFAIRHISIKPIEIGPIDRLTKWLSNMKRSAHQKLEPSISR